MKKLLILFIILNISPTAFSKSEMRRSTFKWEELPELEPVGDQKAAYGVAGAFAGVHNDVMIVAGGANYAEPKWETDKTWHNDILVLEKESTAWEKKSTFSVKVAYGSSVSIEDGILCFGGSDGSKIFDDIWLLSWEKEENKVAVKRRGKMPGPFVYGSAAILF